MFRLDVLQNQWLVVALAGGLVLVLGLVLYYLAMWRQRAEDAPAQPPPKQTVLQWLRSFLPALLIVIYIFALAFVVVYTLAMVRHPPNW